MKTLNKVNSFLKKANEVMKLLNRSIDLFQIVYKNILSIVGIYALYNIAPSIWIIATVIAVIGFIFEIIRNYK